MKSALNNPVETGVRVLTLLVEAYPHPMDLGQLVLLDHSMLHSGDLGGPESLYPPLPSRSGELGVKRRNIEEALQLLVRVELAEFWFEDKTGIQFVASDGAESFLSLLRAPFTMSLRERASWVFRHFDSLDADTLRHHLHQAFNAWDEEFDGPFDGSLREH